MAVRAFCYIEEGLATCMVLANVCSCHLGHLDYSLSKRVLACVT